MSEVINVLADLITIPSVSPGIGEPDDIHGEARMVGYLADRLRRRKIDVELVDVFPGRQNLLARLKGGKGPSLVMEAHTDTVGIHDMTIDPFEPVQADGRMYGRGACDTKGSLAAMLIAFEQAAAKGAPPGDVTLAATCDEEYSFGGVRHLVESGFRADGAVVAEPTQLQLIVAHKGSLRLDVQTHGCAAHSSEPEKGTNAIYAMARVIGVLEQFSHELRTRAPHPLVGLPALSVNRIDGGHAPNVVPDRCGILVDRRTLPTENLEDVEQEITALIREKCPDVEWAYNLLIQGDPGLDGSADSPIARRCARALDAVLGSHTVAGVQYGSDASKFAAAGIQAVVLGAGDIAQAHTACEWIEIAQVEKAVDVYYHIAKHFQG